MDESSEYGVHLTSLKYKMYGDRNIHTGVSLAYVDQMLALESLGCLSIRYTRATLYPPIGSLEINVKRSYWWISHDKQSYWRISCRFNGMNCHLRSLVLIGAFHTLQKKISRRDIIWGLETLNLCKVGEKDLDCIET